MQFSPSKESRERTILSKVVGKSKPRESKDGLVGSFDPYAKTMVPVPPYMTTGSPTPTDNTTLNYGRRGDGDIKAKNALSKIKQFDRGPIAKDKINKLVGTINDEKRLGGINK